MKNRRKATAAMLAAAIAVSSILMPASPIHAGGNQEAPSTSTTEKLPAPSDMTEEEMEEAVMAADGVEITNLPEEDGDYLIYMEPEAAEAVLIENEVQEIAAGSPEVIVETDLLAAEVRELEILSRQTEAVYIEENIYLDGASSDKVSTKEASIAGISTGAKAMGETASGSFSAAESEENESSFLDGMSALERHNWKRALLDQEAAEETEAEWNIQMVHADDQNGESAGLPVKVAVLDSGVEFLAGFPVERSINLVKDEQELPYYMNDMTGHGTAVADIIHNVCPKARIYSVKVMDAKNRGRLSDIVAGIYWCIEQDVDIINMSFGTSVKSDILEKAIGAAAEHGIMMVSSAGNGGTGSAVEYPAAYEEVIAVGAVNTCAEITGESATGGEVELAAPGEQIMAKSLLGLDTVASGTSMAAPHVTGAAALLMMESRYRDAAFIRKVLQKSSNPLGDETYYGCGLLDVSYARQLLHDYEEVVLAEWGSAGSEEISIGEADRTTDVSGGETNSTAQNPINKIAATAQITGGEADGTAQLPTNADKTAPEGEQGEIQPDALDALIQTEKPVETFEEIDYAEGRWTNARHSEWAEKQGLNNGLTATEIKLFKAGATYADIKEHKMKGPSLKRGYWHGNIWSHYGTNQTSNYIANYIFVTKVALAGGNANLSMVPGMHTMEYNDIRNNMSNTILFGRSWDDVINEIDGISGYKDQKRWRQVFIYGLALHMATDAFAHSSCYKANDGTIKKYLHEGNDNNLNPNYDPDYSADHINCTPNRWKCAYNMAGWVAYICSIKAKGDVQDFSFYGFPCWKGFYMGNIYTYAKEIDPEYGTSFLNFYYKSMNCIPPKPEE